MSAFTHVAAGGESMALLQEDNRVVIYMSQWDDVNSWRSYCFHLTHCIWTSIMPLKPGGTFTQIDVAYHAVLLRSDGVCLALGNGRDDNNFGQCDIPALDDGIAYVQVSAGFAHTVLLRNDGRAVACGDNTEGQCNIPPLRSAVTYTGVAAGARMSVLSRSDGYVVVCDTRGYYIPPVQADLTYTVKATRVLVLQVSLQGNSLRFLALSGEERWRTKVSMETLLVDVSRMFAVAWHAGALGSRAGRVCAVLPGGKLLDEVRAGDTVLGAFCQGRLECEDMF